MKIFDYDQKRVLLVTVAQFKNEGFGKCFYVLELAGFNQWPQKFLAKTRTLVADAPYQIVKKDPRIAVGRVPFVPGDPPSTAVRKVDRQHALTGSRATTDDCRGTGSEAPFQGVKQAWPGNAGSPPWLRDFVSDEFQPAACQVVRGVN